MATGKVADEAAPGAPPHQLPDGSPACSSGVFRMRIRRHWSMTHETIMTTIAMTRNGTSEINSGWVSGCGPPVNGGFAADILRRLSAARRRRRMAGHDGRSSAGSRGMLDRGAGRFVERSRAEAIFILDVSLAMVVFSVHHKQRHGRPHAEDINPEPGGVGDRRLLRLGHDDNRSNTSSRSAKPIDHERWTTNTGPRTPDREHRTTTHSPPLEQRAAVDGRVAERLFDPQQLIVLGRCGRCATASRS